MNVWSRLERRGSGEDGRRLKTTASLACALGLHAVILLMVLSWQAPPTLPAPSFDQVGLFAAPGSRVFSAALTPPSLKTHPSPLAKAAAKPPPVAQPSTKFAATVRLRPVFDLPKDVTPIFVDVAVRGTPPSADLTPDLTPVTPPSPAILALATAQTGGKTCMIFDVLQAMLQTSDQVRQALPLIPGQARSVANAVMLWDGHWAAAPTLGGQVVLDPIQSTVLLGISSAPENCQVELVRGPRLIVVGDARNATVLAFGSGEWRWADLLLTLDQTQSPVAHSP